MYFLHFLGSFVGKVILVSTLIFGTSAMKKKTRFDENYNLGGTTELYRSLRKCRYMVGYLPFNLNKPYILPN